MTGTEENISGQGIIDSSQPATAMPCPFRCHNCTPPASANARCVATFMLLKRQSDLPMIRSCDDDARFARE